MTEDIISVAEAKKHFAQLLGKVAYGGRSILITKRGTPMARLVPSTDSSSGSVGIEGWLEADDAFFEMMDRIVEERAVHVPRGLPVDGAGR